MFVIVRYALQYIEVDKIIRTPDMFICYTKLYRAFKRINNT